ncbi:unnamed protein product [Toxocara canis]|uniref:SLC12 domain-containing protein n=1 Tax=Toxocara canis TaxID=6265 RepID=A0A183V2J8_TOXCA|nr:unnamed protein product [Toxocara canis]
MGPLRARGFVSILPLSARYENPRGALVGVLELDPCSKDAFFVLFKDDDAPYANGILTTSAVVFISYLQNCLLLALLIVRLPWIVGFLGFWEFLGAVFFDLILVATVNLFGSEQDCEGVRHLMFIASALLLLCYKCTLHHAWKVLISACSVIAAATNGSDRFFGGPFVVFSNNFGSDIAVVATTLLLLANCGFTAANCMLCAEMITRYVSYNRLVNSAQTHQLLRNNLTVLRALELDTESDGLLLFYFYVFLVIPMIYAGIGKRVVKYFFWVPIIFFEISLGAIIASIVYLKWNEDYETRCVLGEKCLIVERRRLMCENIEDCLTRRYHMRPLGTDQIPTSFLKTLSVRPVFATEDDGDLMTNCESSFFNRIVACSPLKEICHEVPLDLKTITWSFEMAVSNFDINIASLAHLRANDWRSIVYQSRIFNNIIVPVASPLFIIVTIAAVSTAAAGQYMLTSKSLLLSLITSRKFAVPYFFFYRKNKLRHTTAMLLIAVVVAMFAAFGSVDDILIVSGCTMLGALSLVNFSAAFCSAFDFPSWKPATCMFFWPVALLGAFACWLTAFVTKATVVSPLTVCSWFYYLASNIFSRRHPMRAHEEFFLGFANMLLYTIPLGEFRQISTLCISLIRYVYDQQYAGKRDVDASERSMGAMRLPGYATQFMYRKISSLHSIASALANCCGVGAFHSNTVVLDYPSRAALSGAAEQILYHYHMHRVCIRQCNLIVVKGHFPLTMKVCYFSCYEGEQMKIKGNCGNLMSSRIVTPKFIHEVREAFQPQMLIKIRLQALSSQRMIDVWWIIDGGDTLLLLAHILKCNALWQQAVIRLFVVIEASDNGDVVENDIRRWLSSNHLILHTIEILHVDPSYVREYTFLRELKTRQRFREPPKHSLTTTAAAIFGLLVFQTLEDPRFHNGSMLQSAVDRGYCPQSVDPMCVKFQLRAQFLNKTISERSHGSSVVLLNIPEPPAQLERFWVYLTFVDKLTEGLNRALLIRGIDSETSAINYE